MIIALKILKIILALVVVYGLLTIAFELHPMNPRQAMAFGLRYLFFIPRYWRRWVWHRLTCHCDVEWKEFRRSNWERIAIGAYHLLEHVLPEHGPDSAKGILSKDQILSEFWEAVAKYEPDGEHHDRRDVHQL